jgi:hypothetical protein
MMLIDLLFIPIILGMYFITVVVGMFYFTIILSIIGTIGLMKWISSWSLQQ